MIGSSQSGPGRAGTKIRVLIVDDSAVIRRLLTRILEADPGIEVVGTARNGRIAIEMAAQLKPDVVTLDIEMPEMDGLGAVQLLRREHPAIRIIMLSTLTQRGSAATLDALCRGADDYLAKPSSVTQVHGGLLNVELVPKVKQFFVRRRTRPPAAALSGKASDELQEHASTRPLAPPPATGLRKVVVVGVSTGGPQALERIVPQLPDGFPVPVLIVQHMPPMFTRLLAERLQALSHLRVSEARDGQRLEPGIILIAPGDRHMRVRSQGEVVSTVLDQGPPENSCRPSVDVLFRSAAEAYGAGVVSVVLTGMGQDGLLGVRQLAERGAHVIVQDQESSVVWGMPGAIADAGLAHQVLPLHQIVEAIRREIS
jgi:two-component system chemotaxis response regulator CheB